MGLKTKDIGTSSATAIKTDQRREAVIQLMKHHKPLFEKEGVSNPKFIPRLCYPHKGSKVIGFYPKELYGGMDIYIEFCNRDFVPEDPNRTLWKWIFNPEYATEYELSDPHPATKDRRYIIPVEELINVNALHDTEMSAPEAELVTALEDRIDDENFGAGTDVPYDALTLRDYAAIQWKKPVSHKAWLNDLITNTFK